MRRTSNASSSARKVCGLIVRMHEINQVFLQHVLCRKSEDLLECRIDPAGAAQKRAVFLRAKLFPAAAQEKPGNAKNLTAMKRKADVAAAGFARQMFDLEYNFRGRRGGDGELR